MAKDSLPETKIARNALAQMQEALPFLIYGLRREGRIVYIGRGTSTRVATSAREKQGEAFIIEAHSNQDEAIRRETYWIKRLRPELNTRLGDGFKSKDAGADLHLPHYIEHGNVRFSVAVPIESAYSYYALAQRLRAFAGNSHAKAHEFERIVAAALEGETE